MVPEVGGKELAKIEKTVQAMQELGRRLKAADPQTLVFITPHGPLLRQSIVLGGMARLKGDLGAFGAPQVTFSQVNDLEMVAAIRTAAAAAGFPVQVSERWSGRGYHLGPELDHGVMAPLYYLRQSLGERPLVVSTYALLPLEALYAFGTVLRQVIQESGKRVAVVASGDLSHRLLPGAPAGYDPEGQVFDRRLQDLLGRLDVPGIMELPEELVERAGECGLRSLIIALGALEGLAVEVDLLSYEGPFGVGYLVAALAPRGEDPGRRLLEQLQRRRQEGLEQQRQQESLPVRLARETLETYVREGRRPKPPSPLPAELQRTAGVFVSLKKYGQLRGCIGTIRATKPNLAEEIIANAISAGTRDPRFEPVRPEELPELTYAVDVLGEPEPVKSLDELDPKRYGVIVRKGWRSGLLLPDLEGIDTVEAQVRIAKQKAGIAPEEDCGLERFEVTRYH
jgi:AmmeMemoRadiSam system protein A